MAPQRTDYPGEAVTNAAGEVVWECGICGIQITNTRNSVANHLHKKHATRKTAYYDSKKPFPQPILCSESTTVQNPDGTTTTLAACGSFMGNKHSMTTHYRQKHGHCDSSKPIYEKYGVLDYGYQEFENTPTS